MLALFNNIFTINNLLFKLGLLVSFISYLLLGYFTKRTESVQLFSGIFLLFAFYFGIIFNNRLSCNNFNLLLITSFLFRAVLILVIPSLSDDFYRFIWDGRLIEEGINPYLHLPREIKELSLLSGELNNELFTNMNSPNYYSVYPPVLQYVFFIASKFSSSNFGAIIILRLFILLAECGTCFYLLKIITLLKLPKNVLFIYLLNPLAIFEITANLHFEGLMLFFVTAAFYFLLSTNYIFSASFFTLAVCTKLIPLVLLPLVIKKIGFKNGFVYLLLLSYASFLLFIPFISQDLINNIGNSIGLYFQKFEFNASIYYLARWIGFKLTGYNEIAIIGKILPLISFFLILFISFRFKPSMNNKLFFEKSLSVLFIYYLFSLIIHPWYLSFLVLLSVFTNYRYALVWSMLICGSYLTYAYYPFKENTWVLAFEYSIAIIWFVLEQLKLKRT